MFASEQGPADSSTRLVLFVLALHMNQQGKNCFPSQALITKRTGLSERSVRTHLANAVREGWLKIHQKKRPGKQAWFVNEYVALIPADLVERCPPKPWDGDPDYQRAANSAGRSTGEPVKTPKPPRHPANGAERAANGARRPATVAVTPGKFCRDARQGLPTNSSSNSSSNSPKNSSSERAALRAAPQSEDGLKKPVRRKSGAETRAAIQRLITEFPGYTNTEIARIAHVDDVDEVQRVRASP
jgi:hypothetical protein